MGSVMGLFSGKNKSAETDGDMEVSKFQYPRLLVDGRLDVPTIQHFLILETEGTLFYDEDGDVAHEFYEEIRVDGGRRSTMRRITRNLTPQGLVRLRIPRLPADFPLVMCQI
ncbi:tumor suppressor candidate 2-like isoform X2 [Corticium candelabrum]|uniref:tumor suppressor candidate 2-like isoform X2 n=1 Tax=Corticium candelabrum TaxID=121492 RepID=UPI002E265F41|nr:tumor suppressor candidate 2-like isoform X2 [Corticium candelabrum]